LIRNTTYVCADLFAIIFTIRIQVRIALKKYLILFRSDELNISKLCYRYSQKISMSSIILK